jgi:hypothetical protein
MILRGVFESFVFLYPGLLYSLLLFWMELAFAALQENPCRWFLRKVAVLRFCLYSPSTSKMSDIGTLYIRVHLTASRVD